MKPTITKEIKEKFPLTDIEESEIHKFSAFYANKMSGEKSKNLVVWSKKYDETYEELYLKYKPEILEHKLIDHFDNLELDKTKPLNEILLDMFNKGMEYQKNKGK